MYGRINESFVSVDIDVEGSQVALVDESDNFKSISDMEKSIVGENGTLYNIFQSYLGDDSYCSKALLVLCNRVPKYAMQYTPLFETFVDCFLSPSNAASNAMVITSGCHDMIFFASIPLISQHFLSK